MKTIDTHAHLDHLPNLDQALEEAYQAGVEGIVCVSMDLKSCQKNLEIKKIAFGDNFERSLGSSRDGSRGMVSPFDSLRSLRALSERNESKGVVEPFSAPNGRYNFLRGKAKNAIILILSIR